MNNILEKNWWWHGNGFAMTKDGRSNNNVIKWPFELSNVYRWSKMLFNVLQYV